MSDKPPASYGPDDHLVCPGCGARDSVVVTEQAEVETRLAIADGELNHVGESKIVNVGDASDYRCGDCGWHSDPIVPFAPAEPEAASGA